jgi:beta-glucosidase
MPGPTLFRSIEKVHRALESGQVTEADIDARARKVIELIAKIGKTLANNSPPLDFLKSVSEEKEVSLQNEEISKSIRTIGAEGMVLLRNENNLLPLEPTKKGGPKKIAFIGAPAVTAIQSGGGSAK